MTYTHTTFGTLKSLLASRLGDVPKVHWVADELGRTLIETLQAHNALTGSHRTTLRFDTSPGVAFYDLPSLFPDEIGFTLTDQTALALIKYQLMEDEKPTISLTSWGGSEMWTLDGVIRSLERRRNQYLTETQTVTAQRSLPTDLSGIVDLPDSVVAVTRAVWRSSSGIYSQLWHSDEMVFESVLPSWKQSPDVPSSFSIATLPNLQLQLFPPPLETGTIELLTVESGATLDPTASSAGTALGVPNDLGWGPRFGALADLLRQDGPARDSDRAAFCDQLYSLSVDLGRDIPLVLTAAINGVRIPISPLALIDSFSPGWQGRNRDTPDRIAIAGGNLLTLIPIPDGVYSVELQVVRNATIPSSPTDDAAYIQVSRDDLAGILAWAEMLGAFKSQGTQLEHARLGSKLLLDRASAYNERRVLQSTYLAQILERSTEEKNQRPLYHESTKREASTESDRSNTASSHQSRQRSNLARRRRTLGGR